MALLKRVVASLRVEGLHCWPNCPDDTDIAFLKQPHRHEFHIKVWATVTDNDREVEILRLKKEVRSLLEFNFQVQGQELLNFEHRSCEDIAELILGSKALKLSQVEVLEDGENGAVLTLL
jgi:hypothetical protein